jgi:pyrroline-5-carboxylate reductase
MDRPSICFIGAGHISGAVIAGLLSNGYEPEKIWATRRSDEKLQLLQEQFGIHITSNNREAALQADIVVLSAQPSQVQTICAELKPIFDEKKPLIVSVAAGITCKLLQRWSGETLPIIRAMPNLPALVNAGATGLYANGHISTAQKAQVESIFRCVGVTVWVEQEDQMDIITAAFSSGCGYLFLVMDAIQQASVQLGLSEEASRLLTLELVLGSSRIAMQSEKDLAQLLQSVATPGGTTAAGLQVLEDNNIKDVFSKAIQAAWQRAKTISTSLEAADNSTMLGGKR